MAANPLIERAPKGKGEKSPTDPQECCDWANERLHPKAVEANLRWIVTGDKDKPIALRKFI
jgi:hypothetical protein